MSAWLKLSNISVVTLDDKFIIFGVASCISVPNPIFCMALFHEMSCWNHISDYHTVLNPYSLTYWQLTPLRYTDVLSWVAIFHLVVNEKYFSVPFECRTLLKSHDITLNASFPSPHKCNYKKLEHVIMMITWSWSAETGRKSISGLNHFMKHRLQIMLLIRWLSICQCYIICKKTPNIWQKRYDPYIYKKF